MGLIIVAYILRSKGQYQGEPEHARCLSTEYPALSGHLDVKKNSNRDKILLQDTQISKEELGIEHTTHQLEDEESNLKKQENHWDWNENKE
ncbi:hypothetical protein [Halobacillus naozhouensis]|uniref:Uncharacterized protein n=1 Tax=Halobacillus naozhouensis TaxID=554880 RepID=A0ABY8J604_9BACI|nr:hypothetical protein [Halobacillus naozhouensis]WFT76839.1 hypothetical protein P9989_10960 [Halobacillus naozhouensis]